MAFRLGDLSPDIVLLVYERLPSYWHVVSLRLSCKAIDAIYKQYHKQIDQAQVKRLTQPVLDHYRFLTTLHLDADRLELPSPAWNIKVDKAQFATKVICSLPFFRSEAGKWLNINSDQQHLDWRVLWQSHQKGIAEQRIARMPNLRHFASLAWAGVLYIDTMHATIHDFIPRHERPSPDVDISSWRATEDIAAYFKAQRRWLLDMAYIPPFGPSAVSIYLEDHRMSYLRQEDRDTLVAIFVKHGWPHYFDKHEAHLELDAAFDTIRYKLIRT